MGELADLRDSEYARVFHAIDELGSLEPGWNSYRAPAIHEHARERAKSFVASFRDLGYRVPPPSIAPAPSGGVLLVWNIKDLEVQILFNPVGGTYSVGHVDDDGFLSRGALYEVDALKDVVRRYVPPRW
jgi:hypothetical protein